MAIKATLSTTYVDAPEDVYNAKAYAEKAAASQEAAKSSETNAAASQAAAKTSETNAAASATAAKESETNAASSAEASAASQTAAKTSETNAASSEANAKAYATSAGGSATAAANSAKTLTYATSDEAAAGTATDRMINPVTLKNTLDINLSPIKTNIADLQSRTSVSSIRDMILNQIIPQSAAAHNAFYRGKDLTDYFTSGEMSKAIAAGTFADIFIGDYIKKSATIDGTEYKDVIWRVGDLDYNYGRGYTNQNVHHVLMVPDIALGTAKMNSSDTTTGGYQGSAMWTTTIPKYVAGIQNAFGSDHVMEHTELLTNNMDPNNRSASVPAWSGMACNDWSKGSIGKNGHPWATVIVNIFNTIMVFGSPLGSSYQMDYSCNKQIALFRLSQDFVTGTWCWLRDVANSSTFAFVYGDGSAGSHSASTARGVRPYFLLR